MIRHFLAIFVLLFAGLGVTYADVAPMPTPIHQFFDANGKPLAGGKLYTYQAGTTTPLSTYTDSTGETANANPVVLDSTGSASIWIGSSAYKFVLKSSTGTLIWTQDNVKDLALLGTGGVSVKTYGALGDGTTDDTAAISAACTAADGGTVFFPPATYKIISGGITTCAVGGTLQGNGATLDITSLTTYAFGFNIGGSLALTPNPTLVTGFKVLGAGSTNTDALFVEVNNVSNFTMRDAYVYGAETANLTGVDDLAVFDNVSTFNISADAITIAGGDGIVLRRFYCATATIPSGGGTPACLELKGGTVEMEAPFIDAVPVGIDVNGGAISIRGGTLFFRTRNMTGLKIPDANPGLGEVSLTGVSLNLGDGDANTDIVIDNADSTAITLTGNVVVDNAGTSSTLTFLKNTGTVDLTMTGDRFTRINAAAALTIFNLSGSTSTFRDPVITGNSFSALGSSETITFMDSGSTGTIDGGTIASNVFNRVTAFTNIDGYAFVTSNQFTGDANPTFSFVSGNTAALSNNLFNPGATVSAAPAHCANNIGYTCP